MKKRMLLILMVVIVTFPLFASLLSKDTPQYEYMVISFDNEYFSDYESKTYAYWDEGISQDIESASSVERDLDILSSHGWEIVFINGSFANYSEIVLKREIDIKISNNESKISDENNEKISKKLEEIKLIDLDSVDYSKKIKDYEDNLTKELMELYNKILKVDYRWIDNHLWEEHLEVIIYLDVTDECLIDSNSYRTSEVRALLEPNLWYLEKVFENEIIDAFELKGMINFNGEYVEVSSVNSNISLPSWYYR